MHASRGFTVIEVLITIAIFTIIIGLPTMSLYGISRSDNLTFAGKQVKNSLAEAQVLTMSGKSIDGQNPSAYGVYFTTDYYVIFPGSTYSANNPNNELTNLPSGVKLTTIQLPSSTVAYDRVTGKIGNYNSSQRTLVLTETNTGQTQTITLSQLGVVD